MASAFLALMLLTNPLIWAQERTDPHDQPEELGRVSWYRDYQTALSLAHEQDKAVLILFQEVPGCATCRNYGQDVLSHPLLVDAIGHEFVPLVVFNNRNGEDRQVLNLYQEPTWNNPVVRIVDDRGQNIVPRVAGNYSAKALWQAMKHAFEARNQPLPGYLQLLGTELNTNPKLVREAVFEMYCFWSGEGHLGQAPGVLKTEPGFAGGHEVVRVWYDSRTISAQQLTDHARQAKCSPQPTGKAFRPDGDPQYYLKQTPFRHLPLSPLQRTRINSALAQGQTGLEWLSPSQKKWLANPTLREANRYEHEFESAWWDLANP